MINWLFKIWDTVDDIVTTVIAAQTGGVSLVETQAAQIAQKTMEKELGVIEKAFANEAEGTLAGIMRQTLPPAKNLETKPKQWMKDVPNYLLGTIIGTQMQVLKNIITGLGEVKEELNPAAWKNDAINGEPYFTVPYLSGGAVCQRLGAKRKDRTIINAADLGNYTSSAFLESRSKMANVSESIFKNGDPSNSKLSALFSEKSGQWRHVSSMLQNKNEFEE